MADPVKHGSRPDGSEIWYWRISAGTDASGKRIQVYDSFDTEKEARDAHARALTEIRENRFVARRGPVVNAYLDGWEAAHTRDLEAGTAAKIRYLLRPVRDRLGARRLSSLTRADIDALADWMLKSGRRRVGKPGTPLSARTVAHPGGIPAGLRRRGG
jgi:hypothetical protein